jgi:hypothetical protein
MDDKGLETSNLPMTYLPHVTSDLEDEEDPTAEPPVDLSDLICVLIERLPEFKQLLITPKSVVSTVRVTSLNMY